MSDDQETSERPRRHGAQYQPSPLVAGLLISAFIVVVVALGGAVTAISISGTKAPAHATTTTNATQNTSSTIPPSQVKVQVANSTSVHGLARTVTDSLQLRNWDVLGPINWHPPAPATVIYYQPGYAWAARQIGSQIGVPASAPTPWVPAANQPSVAQGVQVLVILGPDVPQG